MVSACSPLPRRLAPCFALTFGLQHPSMSAWGGGLVEDIYDAVRTAGRSSVRCRSLQVRQV